jgi:hypothetical protein
LQAAAVVRLLAQAVVLVAIAPQTVLPLQEIKTSQLPLAQVVQAVVAVLEAMVQIAFSQLSHQMVVVMVVQVVVFMHPILVVQAAVAKEMQAKARNRVPQAIRLQHHRHKVTTVEAV